MFSEFKDDQHRQQAEEVLLALGRFTVQFELVCEAMRNAIMFALRSEDGFLTVLVTNFLRQPSWRDRKIIVVDPTAESIANRLRGYWGVDISSQLLPIEGHLENSVAQLLEVIRETPVSRVGAN